MSNPKVELHILNHGVVTLELDAEKAPKTVENFLAYVNKGHYNQTIFHRVINNFMVQGGGFEPGMQEKKDKRPSIQNEADNGLKNDKYTVAMARTGDRLCGWCNGASGVRAASASIIPGVSSTGP